MSVTDQKHVVGFTSFALHIGRIECGPQTKGNHHLGSFPHEAMRICNCNAVDAENDVEDLDRWTFQGPFGQMARRLGVR